MWESVPQTQARSKNKEVIRVYISYDSGIPLGRGWTHEKRFRPGREVEMICGRYEGNFIGMSAKYEYLGFKKNNQSQNRVG